MTKLYDAIVIGSGFGGSITASRLATSGKSVVVLERGKRYAPGQFPRDVTKSDEIFWRHPQKNGSTGLYDVRFLSGVGTVAAAGVGGGSLIYASIHYRPDRVIFEDARWPSAFNLETLDPYYGRVAETLGVTPLPEDEDIPKRRLFVAAARQLERPHFDVPQAVSWRHVSGAVTNGRNPCQYVAECEFGCNFGAKNTLDFNYLADAERAGAEIWPETLVSHISPANSGWAVHARGTRDGVPQVIHSRRVVLAAGTLGTNEILLRSRDVTKTLPALPKNLGRGYSANGDFLGNVQNIGADIQPWRGPDVTTVMTFYDRKPGFVLAAPTFNQATMEVLASLGQRKPPPFIRTVAPFFWDRLGKVLPWAMEKGLLSQPLAHRGPGAGPPGRMTNLFAIGQDNANGVIHLKKERLDIDWDYARENAELVERQESAMRAWAERTGGTFASLDTWLLFKRIITVHNLGGCAISDSPKRGVVSTNGEVFGHPGLYVADGSIIPTALGCHPVMTISALAEWIAEKLVASYD